MVRLPPRLRPLYPVVKKGVVATTRTVAPITAAVGHWLPTGAVGSLEEAAAPDGRCITVRDAADIPRPPHLGVPADLPPLEPAVADRAPRSAVAELPGGRVLGPHRAVITGDGRLVDEVSRYFVTRRPGEHPLYLNPFPGAPVHVPGRVAVLACRGDGNYYHFLIDALSRLSVLADAGLLEGIDRYLVPTRQRFQRELLDLVGIAPERRLDPADVPHLRADVLVVPSLPAAHEVNPPWVVEYLRARLLPAAGPEPRERVYVTRGPGANNRAVRNEAAVRELLAERGFSTVDPGALGVRDQIALFAGARTVVSAHGAALANLAFVPPGCAVVELFPAGGVLPDYWRLVSAIPGVRYRYLSAWPTGRPLTRQSAIVRDIDVNVPALATMLEELD